MQSMNQKRVERLKDARTLRAKAPIAAQFEDCFQAFQQLSDALQVNPSHPTLNTITTNYRLRLELWGDDSSASTRTLDYALRDSSLLERQTLRLLVDLHVVLEEAISRIRSQDLDAVIEASVSEEPSKGADSNDDPIIDDQDAEAGPEKSLQEAGDILTCLIELLPALRDPLDDHDQPADTHDNDGDSEEVYQQIARALFPGASKPLIHRLSRNNWRSRQRIRRSTDGTKALSDLKLLTRPIRSGSVLWSPRNFRHGQNMDGIRRQSSRTKSDTETATNLSNMESDLSIKALIDQESTTSATDIPQPSILQHLVPPQPPVDLAKVEQFDCPYCRLVLPLTMSSKGMDQDAWVTHVYQDLRPYVCTSASCDQTDMSFNNREEWFQHELSCHRSRMVWSCGLCHNDYSSAKELETHLLDSECKIPCDNLGYILDSCRRYSQELPISQICTLCGAPCYDIDDLEHHLADHLEVFSLATIVDNDLVADDGSEGVGTLVLTDYINEQFALLEGDERTLLPGVETGTLPTLTLGHFDTDASRVAETSDPSGLDGPENEDKKYIDDSLAREKVQIFLDKQTTENTVDKARSNVAARVENFTGRNTGLKSIHQHLSTPGRICTISGRSGVGKTCLAREYIYVYESEYSYVFWVDAETPGTCAEMYSMIASSIKLGDDSVRDENAKIFAIKETLAKTQRRWLLIFDNVTSWGDISHYIPRNLPRGNGSVLVVTRSGSRLSIPPKVSLYQFALELDVWPLERAREFLLTSIQSWRLDEDDLQGHEEYEVAAKVVNIVGCLPLAISIIVGYVKVSRCTLSDFLEMWEENDGIRKTKEGYVSIEGDEMDATIDLLWTIGIKEVKVNSRRFLEILAFFDPKSIQKSLLVGDHKEEEYLSFLNSSETISYKRMINELHGRRLLSIKDADNSDREPSYAIPKLLQRKILLDMKDYGFTDAFRKAFRLIRKRFPSADSQQVPDPQNFDICQEYMPHVSNLHRVFNQMSLSTLVVDPKPIDIATLFYDAGFYVWARQTTGYDCLELLYTTERILDGIGTDENEKIRADILCLIGLELSDSGCVERRKSVELLKRALNIRVHVFDNNKEHDNDVLLQNASTDLSLSLLNDHQFDEAGKAMRKCREQYLKWGPEAENPFEHSKFYGNYCVVLMMQGNMTEALNYATLSVELTRKFSGENAMYCERLYMLACTHMQSRNYQAALEKHLEVLAARIELHGRLNEQTILSLYSVGATYYYMRDLLNATEYIKQCIECTLNSKWDRVALARAQCHLSILYKEQGIKEDEARTLEVEAIQVLNKFGSYAPECVQRSEDKLLHFHDLQPTFLGRFTGPDLLPYLQEYARRGELS